MEHSGALWGILEYSGAFWSTLEYSGVLRSTLEYFFSIIFGVILIFEAFLASFLSREETRNLVDETISREKIFCEKIGNTSIHNRCPCHLPIYFNFVNLGHIPRRFEGAGGARSSSSITQNSPN